MMYQLAGGSLFAPAALLLAASVVINGLARRRWIQLLSVAASILALTLIAISAEALPLWFYVFWTIAAVS